MDPVTESLIEVLEDMHDCDSRGASGSVCATMTLNSKPVDCAMCIFDKRNEAKRKEIANLIKTFSLVTE